MSARDYVEKDYYAALGVPKDADAGDIKKAYRKLARDLHPDTNPGGEARFKEVSEAYDVLSDSAKRKEYDEARALFGSGGYRPGAYAGGGVPGFDLGDLFARAGGQAGGLGDVFGAGTNYALLLVARYRDELRRQQDRFAAMDRALRTTTPAILASGGTVALSLLTLLFADLTSNRGLGFGGAVGVVTAMVFGLVVLPAALVLPGRWLFWPFVPRVGDPTTAERAGLWSRLGRLVSRRPAAVTAGSLVLLGALSLGALGASTGLALADSFRDARGRAGAAHARARAPGRRRPAAHGRVGS